MPRKVGDILEKIKNLTHSKGSNGGEKNYTPQDSNFPEENENQVEFPTPDIPKELEPIIYQFKIIGELQKKLYEHLLGYALVYDKDTQQWKKERVYEPIVSEWGANNIMTLVSWVTNEQTPFANLSDAAIIKLVHIFLEMLNMDMVTHYDKYFEGITGADESPLTHTRKVLTVVGSFLIEVLSRSVGGKESDRFYSSPFKVAPQVE